MGEDLQRWNSFNTIELYLVKRLHEIEAYYYTYSEDTKRVVEKELQVLGDICRLKQRNASLAKIIYLKSLLPVKTNDYESLAAKRGRKLDEYDFHTKFVMAALKCSRRSAVVYQAFLRAERHCEELWALMYQAASRIFYEEQDKKKQESETQHVTVSTRQEASP